MGRSPECLGHTAGEHPRTARHDDLLGLPASKHLNQRCARFRLGVHEFLRIEVALVQPQVEEYEPRGVLLIVTWCRRCSGAGRAEQSELALD